MLLTGTSEAADCIPCVLVMSWTIGEWLESNLDIPIIRLIVVNPQVSKSATVFLPMAWGNREKFSPEKQV